VHIVTLFYCFSSGICAWWRNRDTWPTISRTITDRPGPMMCRLATRNSHSTVGEVLFLTSVAISCNITWRINDSLTSIYVS